MTAHRPGASDRLIVADADRISGADFFRAVFGRPPLTDEERAEKKRLADEYWERRHREFEEETARIRQRTAEIIRKQREARGACVRCGTSPVRETLDGDPLCQGCCDAWVRGERDAA